MSLKNKVAIVTGGSSGIGAAIAKKFAVEGAQVVIVGRNKSKLDNVARSCEEIGSKPLIITAEVTNDEDLKGIVSQTIKKFGRLDILVNNAGVGGRTDLFDEAAMEIFDKVIATNLRSAVALTTLAVPHLIESKGNIVNISSVASTAIIGTGFAYNTSKAALDHFMRCSAMELASEGVRVNGVNPGPVRTDIVKNSTGVDDPNFEEKVWESMKRGTALKRISDPEEVADLVLFLASDKGKGITGASIFIDNGVLIKSKL